MKRLLSLFVSILLAYLLVLVVIRMFESRLIFFPNYPGRLDGDWHPSGLNVEDVWLTASDGVKLHAWWIPDDKARFAVLAFHGNASNIANRAPTYEFLRESHVNILALEYRGYGRSEGKPSESGIYLDAEAAYDFLVKSKGIDSRMVVSFGQSLGSAVATHLATRRQVGGVVLEAPFPSASRMANKVFWFFPGLSLLTYGQFDTGTWLKRIHAPVLIVHCSEDPVIPFEFGREVFEQALPPKSFLEVNGYCHEESSTIAPARYRAVLQEFLNGL
ncbi:MAG TPA: alpha/beta hydrolase [Candidatus Acidoferrum sp.]|nr:alpha/beta hydrolase [Candidatus Acidoferrum sp.]